MQSPTLFNIQKFSIHDGDGIRTTVFFKGCPLSCLWCHNPESQKYQKELMYYADRCSHCGACVKACPTHAISADITTDRTLCTACGACTSFCLFGAREIIGYEMDVDRLVAEIVKDTPFYEVSGGGVTLSGGEPLSQNMDFIETLCKRLHRRGYRIDIDTCGHVPYEHFQRVLPYVDTFLFDLKAMDPERHRKLTGVSNEQILRNLKALSDDGAKISLRLPLVAGVNDDDEEIRALVDLSRNLHIHTVHLLPYHKTGSDKYERIGRTDATLFEAPSTERLEKIREEFMNAGISSVKIGG